MSSPEAADQQYMPFDELRNDPETQKMGRADVIFGPDMFDPRIAEGYTPLSDALDVALHEGKLADLGLTVESRSKTVGEIWGDIGLAELGERCFEVSRRLGPKPFEPLPRTPLKDFLRRALTFY